MPASQFHQQTARRARQRPEQAWMGSARGGRTEALPSAASVQINRPPAYTNPKQNKNLFTKKKKKNTHKKSRLLTLRDSAEDMWRNDQCFRTHGTQPRATNLPILCLSVCLPGLPIVVAHGHKTLLVPPVELRPPSSAQIGSGVAGFVARFIASPDGCVTAL